MSFSVIAQPCKYAHISFQTFIFFALPMQEQQKELKNQEELSSLVWICTSTHSATKVIIIDAVQPGNILDSFTVCNSHVLCISSVPGKSSSSLRTIHSSSLVETDWLLERQLCISSSLWRQKRNWVQMTKEDIFRYCEKNKTMEIWEGWKSEGKGLFKWISMERPFRIPY